MGWPDWGLRGPTTTESQPCTPNPNLNTAHWPRIEILIANMHKNQHNWL